METEIKQPLDIRYFDASILKGKVHISTFQACATAFALYKQFAGIFEAMLQLATLAKWSKHLMGQEELSPHTIDQMVNSVRNPLRAGAVQGYITHDLVDALSAVESVKPPKEPKALRTVIGRADVYAICAAPDQSPAGLMHRALLLTMATCTAPVHSIVSLRLSPIKRQVRADKVRYLIRGIERATPLSIAAFEAIDEWLTARAQIHVEADCIFTGIAGQLHSQPAAPITVEKAWNIVGRYAYRLGLSVKRQEFRRFAGPEKGEAIT